MNTLNEPTTSHALTTTVTQRGQITIPISIQRKLGIKPKTKLTFQLQGQNIILSPTRFTLTTAFGSVKPLAKPTNFTKIIHEAKTNKHSPHQ